MFRSSLAALCVLLASSAVCWADERISALQTALETSLAELGAPGISATVILPDGNQWTGTAGQAAAGVPVSSEMAFEVGSITKLYTAATVLLLAENELVELDGTLDQWVPDFPGSDQLTVRQLLQHTSGLYNVHDDPEFMPQLFMDPTRRWQVEEILERVAEPYFPPGQGWHYSNTNYLLLGLVIEKASGQSVSEAMRELLFAPLDLQQTWFAAEESIPGPRAHAFMDFTGNDIADDITDMMPDTAFMTAHFTAGAIMASSADVARFVQALFTGQLLGTTMQHELLSFVDRPDGKQYGLGVLREQINEIVVFGHRGNSIGFSAVAWYAPELGISVSILANVHAAVIHPADHRLLIAARGETTQPPAAAGALSQARVSLEGEDYEAVIRSLEPEVEANPDNREALIVLSRAYISSLSARSPVRTYRRSQLLVEYLNRAIELDPDDSEPYWLLMNFHLQAPAMVGGDRDKALDIAKTLVDIDQEWGYRSLERYYRHTRQGTKADHYADLLDALDD
jgi:D-alanyl-D-alanine carboxypeptidase